MDPRTQLTALANEQLENRDFQMAIKILNTTIRLEPDKYEHYLERSSCHLKLGNYQSGLDDCNTAIRLNSNDPAVHYSKGLALIGLSMFSDAIVSFKKAIELRAKQEDSKLSDIFHLLKEAIGAVREARQGKKPSPQSVKSETCHSTTDKPTNQPEVSSNNHNQSMTSIEALMRVSNPNGNSSLVAPDHKNQTLSSSNQMSDSNNSIFNRGSSSSGHPNKQSTSSNTQDASSIYTFNSNNVRNMSGDLSIHQASQLSEQEKSAQAFEWSIRRSERIFLHNSSESGVPGVQYAIISRPNEPLPPGVTINPQRLRTNSNPSSIDSGNNRSATKRAHDNNESHTYQPTRATKSREEGTNSYAESEIDVVDDSHYNPKMIVTPTNIEDQAASRKRLVVAPSSSMSATPQEPVNPATKDDSYSTKYKRLRRDRERARRGTSKLCTIKHSDLEDMQKPSTNGQKRHMRVIAPIDGWLYSGVLTVDDSCKSSPRYVVKLDGDASGNTYLFNADTVLNDVIKEVRVEAVSDLRKGARICCYWSRQYKCLSTGVVTSRTFEPSKSLVSVKYDNGDLSALPLEDLRLLPPDYPKYMSNCDPLLLARNGDNSHVTTAAISNDSANQQNVTKIENVSSPVELCSTNSNKVGSSTKTYSKVTDINYYSATEKSSSTDEDSTTTGSNALLIDEQASIESNQIDQGDIRVRDDHNDDDDDATIPPTDETIDFITSEAHPHGLHEDSLDQSSGMLPANELTDRVSIQGAAALNIEPHMELGDTRIPSEENNFVAEYRPWVFEGPPRKSKRNGRTYKNNYSMIRRGNEVIRIGDSAELMPKDRSELPFVAKIDELWAVRGEMRVKVRWYYRLEETKGEPSNLPDGQNALFETDHDDENDVQSISRSTLILPWSEYRRVKHENGLENSINGPKLYYLAGHYDPFKKIKRLRLDVKETNQVG